MHTLVWILVVIGSLIGGIDFVLNIATAESAPQQAAAAAMAIGWAVLPYVFARACDELANYNRPPQPRVGDDKAPPKKP